MKNMKKLRICMVASEFPPHCAGIGSSVYNLSRVLVGFGHKVTVLTRGKYFHEEKRNFDGVDVIELPFIPFPPPFHLIYHGFFVNRKLKKMLSDFDILHLHTPLVPKIAARLPKIASVHSLWLEEGKYFQDSNDLYSLAVKIFENQVVSSEKTTLKQADKIISYPDHKNTLVERYRINPRLIKVANGIIRSDFTSDQKIEKEYDIVFVGRLNPQKGVKELIKAAELISKKIPNVKLLIVGDGTSKKWMEAEIVKKNIKRNFTFLGFVPNSGIAEYIIKSRVCMMPSRYESFGIVTGEAMMCGLPVVGTNTDGSTRLIKDGITGFLVDVGDYESLANRAIDLLNDKNMAKKMGAEGKKRVNKYFNANSIAKQFESIYRSTI